MDNDSTGVHPKVLWATGGSMAGFGLGKMLTAALASFGILTPAQAEATAPLIDFLSTVGMTFLGGYVKRG